MEFALIFILDSLFSAAANSFANSLSKSLHPFRVSATIPVDSRNVLPSGVNV